MLAWKTTKENEPVNPQLCKHPSWLMRNTTFFFFFLKPLKPCALIWFLLCVCVVSSLDFLKLIDRVAVKIYVT